MPCCLPVEGYCGCVCVVRFSLGWFVVLGVLVGLLCLGGLVVSCLGLVLNSGFRGVWIGFGAEFVCYDCFARTLIVCFVGLYGC